MGTVLLQQALRARATRVARSLVTAATRIDGWVSAEACVRNARGDVLRPSVVVAVGEPPSDGVAAAGVVLVVELDACNVGRWLSPDMPTVWAACGDGAVIITRDGRRTVPNDGTLTVAEHPALVLPVDVLHATAAHRAPAAIQR